MTDRPTARISLPMQYLQNSEIHLVFILLFFTYRNAGQNYENKTQFVWNCNFPLKREWQLRNCFSVYMCVCVCVCACVLACMCVFIPSVLPCFDYTLRALSCPYCRMPPPGSLSTNASSHRQNTRTYVYTYICNTQTQTQKHTKLPYKMCMSVL